MYLTQPHAAQVVAIFRLLGFDTNDESKRDSTEGASSEVEKGTKAEVCNHLAQIMTGEGKSVTLAVTAVLSPPSDSFLASYSIEFPCVRTDDSGPPRVFRRLRLLLGLPEQS